jgi:hypothetical protein
VDEVAGDHRREARNDEERALPVALGRRAVRGDGAPLDRNRCDRKRDPADPVSQVPAAERALREEDGLRESRADDRGNGNDADRAKKIRRNGDAAMPSEA